MKDIRIFNFAEVKYRHAIWIQDVIISFVFFLIILFRIYPPLLFELQRPIFFTNWIFLKEHLLLPGAPVDYVSALCSQIFEYPIFGALLLTVIIGSISLLTRKIINILWKVQVNTLHWLPGLFLLFLYSNYRTPFSLAIGATFALTGIWIFLKWAPKSIGLRISLYTILSGLLYWICGGPFLLFPIFCIIWEWTSSKSLTKGAIYFFISTLLFVIGTRFLFLVWTREAIINNLPLESNYSPAFASWGFLLFFPLIGCLTFIIQHLRKILEVKLSRFVTRSWIAGTVILLIISYVAGWIVPDYNLARRLMLFRSARKNNLETVLHLGKDPAIADPNTSMQVNRALWYSGKLLDSAFAYPQRSGTIGLLPNKELCVVNPEAASNLFFELGLISESLHWNIELMEMSGKTPELLDRIGVIFFLKGEIETAKIFWKKMKYTLQGREKAKSRLRAIEEKDLLEKSKTFREFSDLIPDFDFISLADLSDRELLFLLRQNPKNRMAFEYWVAYQLLKGNPSTVWSNINKFRELGYERIPLHVQEALVLYAYLSKWTQLKPLQPYVDYSLVQRFSKFQQILAQHRSDRVAARQALKQEFGDTYWYYFILSRPNKS
jgi:hypothetical protein